MEEKLNKSERTAGDTNVEVFARVAQDSEAVQHLLKVAKQDLERHKVFLDWIEQERQAMESGQATPIEADDQDAPLKIMRRTSVRRCQAKRSAASAVLGKARVLKATPKERNTQIQNVRALEFNRVIQNCDGDPQYSTPSGLKHQVTKSGGAKEKSLLNAFRPQRMRRVKQSADASALSLPEIRFPTSTI